MLLAENTEWKNWAQRLQSTSLRALHLVERKLTGGQTIRYAKREECISTSIRVSIIPILSVFIIKVKMITVSNQTVV